MSEELATAIKQRHSPWDFSHVSAEMLTVSIKNISIMNLVRILAWWRGVGKYKTIEVIHCHRGMSA